MNQNVTIDFDNPLCLSPTVVEQIRRHAISKWPFEMFGIIVNGMFLPQENKSLKPEDEFEMDPELWTRYEIQGIIHTHCHPKHDPEPSADDIRHMVLSGVPWGVVYTYQSHATKPLWFGDFRLNQPLKGRKFIKSVLDCYGLVRAYQWQTKQVLMPEAPRDPQWIAQKQDLYNTSEIKKMTKRVSKSSLLVGDIVIMKISATFPDHFGIVSRDGMMLHHLEDQLSGETVMNRYDRFIEDVVRLKEVPHA